MKIEINENSCIIDGIEYEKKQPTPKDGEIWYVKAPFYEWLFVAKTRDGLGITDHYFGLCLYGNTLNTISLRVCADGEIKNLRPATPEEIALLHTKLKENGKCWNPDTKTLEDYRELKVGDLAIFWDKSKEIALIGELTAIETNDLAILAYVSNGLGFNNAIPFESIEQYEQFRKS